MHACMYVCRYICIYVYLAACMWQHLLHVLFLPHCLDELAPIPFSVATQLFAYHIARLRGTDIDQPRNLAKSVTVEELS